MTNATKILSMLTVLLLLSHNVALAAEPIRLQVQWKELAGYVSGKKVAVVLNAGQRLEGKALAVELDLLLLDIKKTSDPALYPKGRRSVARSSISNVETTRMKGRWRLWAPLIAWMVPGGILGERLQSPAFFILPIAATVAYFIGREADRKILILTIVPETP